MFPGPSPPAPVASPAGGRLQRNAQQPDVFSIMTLPGNAHKLNRATMKHRKYKLLKTLNHACVIWDSKAKPRGLLGGHLNIRSITSKCEQVQHLLYESNLDFLCISETWLHANSLTAGLNVIGYNIFRKDKSEGRGGGVMFYENTESVDKYNGNV